MTRTEEQTIEAEVVEIDGIAVDPRANPKPTGKQNRVDWRAWQGKIRTLDARWWPLWVVLGFILLTFAVAIGMCALVFFVCYKLVMGFFQALLSLFSTPTHIRTR